MLTLGQDQSQTQDQISEIVIPERTYSETTVAPALNKADFTYYLPLVVIFSAMLIGLYVYKRK